MMTDRLPTLLELRHQFVDVAGTCLGEASFLRDDA
jgi:hypothetical protein